MSVCTFQFDVNGRNRTFNNLNDKGPSHSFSCSFQFVCQQGSIAGFETFHLHVVFMRWAEQREPPCWSRDLLDLGVVGPAAPQTESFHLARSGRNKPSDIQLRRIRCPGHKEISFVWWDSPFPQATVGNTYWSPVSIGRWRSSVAWLWCSVTRFWCSIPGRRRWKWLP